jgi:glutamate-1-semialdehyde 2,1-aminomutase
MQTKEDMIRRAKKVIPGGVNSGIRNSEPFMVWKSGKGAYLFDWDDKKYIDYNAAWGVNILGYNYDGVDNAVKEAVGKYGLYGMGTTEIEIELAERIHKYVPSAEKVLVTNSGSEATYHAVRVARAHTGREKIIKLQGGFHGWHDYVLVNCYSPKELLYKRNPGSAGMLSAAIDSTLICRINDLDNVEKTVKENEGQIAAIIAEPIAHNIGCVQLEQEFLEGLRKLCDEHGIVLIYDEIITGFRVGMGGYQEICGVIPDLTTLGKAVANGYPIAILAGKQEIMDRFTTNPGGDVVFQGTYNASPLNLVAAIATIDILKDGKVFSHTYKLGDYFRKGLQEIFDRLGIEATMIGYGSISVPVWAKGPFRNHEEILKDNAAKSLEFRKKMIEKGHYFTPADLKRLVVCYSHTKDDLDETFQAAEEVLRTIR